MLYLLAARLIMRVQGFALSGMMSAWSDDLLLLSSDAPLRNGDQTPDAAAFTPPAILSPLKLPRQQHRVQLWQSPEMRSHN
jgi:hypothetical protein